MRMWVEMAFGLDSQPEYEDGAQVMGWEEGVVFVLDGNERSPPCWKGAVMVICKSCGAESPDGFRFWPACGERLAGPAPRQARKVVTALFCDVTGSTALGEELDPEVFRGVMDRYFAEIRGTIERHGGRSPSSSGMR